MFDPDEKFEQEPEAASPAVSPSSEESPAPEEASPASGSEPAEAAQEPESPDAPSAQPVPPAGQPGWTAAPPPQGAAPQGWANGQQAPYTYSPPPMGGYGPPPQGPGYPQQHTQWTFNDYGPIGPPPKPRKPKPEKKPRSEKQRHSGNGMKVLAIVMSALFVLSVAGFGGYILYDNQRIPPAPTEPGDPGSGTVSEPFHIQDPPPVQSGGSNAPAITGEQLSPSELYEAVEPAVVGVAGYIRSGTTGVYQLASQGSGIIFDANGYIVTNRHVIKNETTDQNFDRVEVIRNNGETYTAEVIGSDRETDLAVLKVEAEGLPTAVFGDSDRLKVGDQAFVIGNPSGIVYAGSLAGGYISAVNREVTMSDGDKLNLIQTDAAINPGNSGGALVDVYGQVVGITSAKLVGTSYEGMGFAIPINDAKPIVESLIDNGYVTGRVEIGIGYQVVTKATADLNGIPQGLRVAVIYEGSDALEKGLQLGDLIYAMDGVEVKDTPDVKKVLEGKSPGDSLLLSVYRVDLLTDRAERLQISVTLREKDTKEN